MNTNSRQKSSQDLKLLKLEKDISAMKSNQVVNALKQKSLPVYGTLQQKRERLLNFLSSNHPNGIMSNKGKNEAKSATNKNKPKRDNTRTAIDKINQNRELRRRKMEEKKIVKLQKEVSNQEQGIKCDVDFQLMVEHEKSKVTPANPHKIPDLSKINICVRKRPLSNKEALNSQSHLNLIDVVS